MIKASVIVPAYNAEKTVGRLLESVLSQDYPAKNYEVIVVNDGSTDKTTQIVKKFPVRLFSQKNQGAGTARNVGAKRAKGEVLLFADSDCLIPNDWVRKHLKAHQKKPKVGIIGGGVRTPEKNTWLVWADYLCSWHNAHENLPPHLVKEYLPSLNLSVKKEAFKKTGGFWKKKLTGEDVDFGRRAKKEGVKIWFEPELAIWDQPRSLKGFFKHNFDWGYHAPFVRGKEVSLKFNWLFSGGFLKAILVFPLIIFGWPVYLLTSWWRYQPLKFIICLPLIFSGRFVYGLGFLKGVWEKRKSHDQ